MIKPTKHGLLCGAVFLCFFALYALTAQRGVGWQDSGAFQYRVLVGDYLGHAGIALSHPMYILSARGFCGLFPKSHFFYAINLFSGLGLAVALTLLSATVVRLTGSMRAAALAAAALGFAHMAWWMGTIAEVYTWSLALLMAEMLCVTQMCETGRRTWLVALFGLNGLHLAVHNFALIGLPIYVVLLLRELRTPTAGRGRLIAAILCAWVAGAGLLLWQAALLFVETGSVREVAQSLLFGKGYEDVVLGTAGLSWRLVLYNAALAAISLMNPCWLWALLGFSAEAPTPAIKRVAAYLRVLTVLHVVFWARYFVPDQATFILPTLGLLAFWVGVGCGWPGRTLPGGRAALLSALCALCGVVMPLLVTHLVERWGAMPHRSRELPFRNELAYWALPWKQTEKSAAQFVAAVEGTLRPGDVLVADETAAGPLMAARAMGALSVGWRLITPWSGETDDVLRNLAEDRKTRMFVVSPVSGYTLKPVLEAAKGFEREGVLYRVK